MAGWCDSRIESHREIGVATVCLYEYGDSDSGSSDESGAGIEYAMLSSSVVFSTVSYSWGFIDRLRLTLPVTMDA